jgi:hypothetical protein
MIIAFPLFADAFKAVQAVRIVTGRSSFPAHHRATNNRLFGEPDKPDFISCQPTLCACRTVAYITVD